MSIPKVQPIPLPEIFSILAKEKAVLTSRVQGRGFSFILPRKSKKSCRVGVTSDFSKDWINRLYPHIRSYREHSVSILAVTSQGTEVFVDIQECIFQYTADGKYSQGVTYSQASKSVQNRVFEGCIVTCAADSK